MSKKEEISKLDRNIKDAEIRKRTFITNIEAISKEIDQLYEQEKMLEDNIRCLKSDSVIAVAKEYQKAKEELKKIRVRMLDFLGQKGNYMNVVKDLEKVMDMAKKELDRLQSIDNVLIFRRKDG